MFAKDTQLFREGSWNDINGTRPQIRSKRSLWWWKWSIVISFRAVISIYVVLHLTETFMTLLLPAMKHGSEISSVVSTDSILFPDIHPSVLWRIFQKEGDKIENRALERRSARSILCEPIDICIHIHRRISPKNGSLNVISWIINIFEACSFIYLSISTNNYVVSFWKEAG